MPKTFDELFRELRSCAGFENLAGATAAAEALVALDGDAAVHVLVQSLEKIDDIDLSDDAGDVADEVWRLRSAITHGLVLCGKRAIEPLRAIISKPRSDAGEAALLVLAKLGDDRAVPVAIDWVERGVTSAFVPLALLAPPNAVELLARAIERAAEPNAGWTKRSAAHALGKIKTDAALDVLERQLGDADWYARLGAAEALREITGERARRLLERARQDTDPRVAAVAKAT